MTNRRWWWLVVTVLVVGQWGCEASGDSGDSEDNVHSGLEDSPLTEVMGVAGGRVLLPCDLTPPKANDTTLLVLFYRIGVGTPIYSLDARGGGVGGGRHWAARELGGRGYLEVGSGRREGRRRGLLLDHVTLDDAGDYRCRVDFLESPTRNLRLSLNVIVPPNAVKITADVAAYEGEGGGGGGVTVAGPYTEGSSPTLTCTVTGGSPPPNVTWWRDWALLDNTSEVRTAHTVKNFLTLPPLGRGDLNTSLTCQATNTDLTVPVMAKVRIEMTFPPGWVRLGTDGPGVVRVAEGELRPLVCEAGGSRPPATITWLKDGTPISQDLVEVEVEGEVVRSRVTLAVDWSDDGAAVTCRANSPRLQHISEADHATLDVSYKPRVEVGVEEGAARLEEGDDLRLECRIQANPPATTFLWHHDGVLVQNETVGGEGGVAGGVTGEGGVAVSRLELLNVTRATTGVYTCGATNTQGSTTSTHLPVDVMYVPLCAEGGVGSYGVGVGEEVLVSCHVEAHPPPTEFRWAMNTSEGMVDIPPSHTQHRGLTSLGRYTPDTPKDFGHVLCWAINDAGTQRKPCVFSVEPAGKPESVSGCVAERNATMPSSWLVVACVAGWDGGLNQTFTLEVRQVVRENLLQVFRYAPEPAFVVRGIQPEVHYLLTVRAENRRGKSDDVTISYLLQGPPSSAPSSSTSFIHHARSTFLTLLPFVVLLMGALLLLTVYVGLGVARKRKKRKRKEGLFVPHVVKECNEGSCCIIKDLEKEELMKLTLESDVTKADCPDFLLNNYGGLTLDTLETDLLLKDKLATLNSDDVISRCDVLGRCGTPSSICTTSSKASSSSNGSSSSSRSHSSSKSGSSSRSKSSSRSSSSSKSSSSSRSHNSSKSTSSSRSKTSSKSNSTSKSITSSSESISSRVSNQSSSTVALNPAYIAKLDDTHATTAQLHAIPKTPESPRHVTHVIPESPRQAHNATYAIPEPPRQFQNATHARIVAPHTPQSIRQALASTLARESSV